MASNNFCPAHVDRKPMLLPTYLILQAKKLKKVFSSVITIMASNNFCPAHVDRKPMLLPTYRILQAYIQIH